MAMPHISKSEAVPLHSIKTKPSEQIRLSSSRLLSRDLSIGTGIDTNDFDVYYRESSVSIPFDWESRPGTPKVKWRESPTPPLTPPPSFHSSPRRPGKKVPRNNLVSNNHHVLLSKLSLRKKHNESKEPRISSPPRMSFDSGLEEYECESSPVSTLCYRAGRSSGTERYQGCSFSIIKLLLGSESKLALH